MASYENPEGERPPVRIGAVRIGPGGIRTFLADSLLEDAVAIAGVLAVVAFPMGVLAVVLGIIDPSETRDGSFAWAGLMFVTCAVCGVAWRLLRGWQRLRLDGG